jgi:hypothetical protein
MQTSLILLAGLAFCGGAAGTTDGRPYQAIVTRNVFGLKDPPPPPSVVEPVKPPPNLILTGITTFGKTRALLKASPAPPKPGEQPKGEQSFILGEGERQGDVQVVSINPALGKVTLNIGGESVTIGFEDNSRSKGRPVGVPAAPLPGFAGALPPQQFPVAGIPQSQPAQLAQPVQAVAMASVAAVQPEGQTGLALAQTAGPDFQAAGNENPYARRAIQHPGFDPTPGAVQTRRPFPTRSLQGRGPAAYRALATPGPDAEAPAPPAPQ